MANSSSNSKLPRASSGYRYTNSKARPSTASFVNYTQMKTEHKYENINISIIE
jgi:chromosome segregation ATPase